MSQAENATKGRVKTTLPMPIQNDSSFFKKHNQYLDGVDDSEDSKTEIIDKNGNVRKVRKKTQNDEKIEDTIIFQLQRNVAKETLHFENLSMEKITDHINKHLTEEETRLLNIIQFEPNEKTQTKMVSAFYKAKYEEYFLERYPKLILESDFTEFCESTNINAFKKVDRMISALDKFEETLWKKCLTEQLKITDKEHSIDKESHELLFFKQDNEEFKALPNKESKSGFGFEKENQLIMGDLQSLYFIDETGLDFPVQQRKDGSLFYVKPKVEIQKKTDRISLIKDINYSFKPEANELIDEIDLNNDLEEFKQAFLKSRNIRNKYGYFDKILVELDPMKLYFLLTFGKNFSYLIKPFRDKFTSAYTFRLDEIIRKKIYYAKRNKQPYIDLGTYDEFKAQMECTSIATKHFKNDILKTIIEEFNKITQDIEILKLEEQKSGQRISNVRLHINQIDTDIIVDYIFVKIKSILYATKTEIQSTKGFKNSIKFKLWNDDLPFYSKTMLEWRELAKSEIKYIPLVKEIIAFLDEDGENILSYDEKKYRIKKEEELIKEVTDIQKSLKFLKEHLFKEYFTLYDFKDVLLFKDEPVAEDFAKLEKQMLTGIKKQDIKSFTLAGDDEKKFETFVNSVQDGSLQKITELFKSIQDAEKELEK